MTTTICSMLGKDLGEERRPCVHFRGKSWCVVIQDVFFLKEEEKDEK